MLKARIKSSIESLKGINRSINRLVEKNLLVSVFSKILWFLGLYVLLQTLFGFPKFVDALKYITSSSWELNVYAFSLKGNVHILNTNVSRDSLVAWSESDAYLSLKVSNNISQSLRIDSIRLYPDEMGQPVECDLVVDKGSLNPYRDSYVLAEKEEVDIRLLPREIKGNIELLKSIIEGKQKVIVFTDRGKSVQRVTHFIIKDKDENTLREID